MQVSKDKVVSIDYTLKDDAGQVLDSSTGRAPLPYLHGAGNIIPGLEAALEGKTKGERVQVSIAPADGYGERDEQMVQEVPRQQLAQIPNLQAGMQLAAQTPDGGRRIVTIVHVDDNVVRIDANHPMAGRTLHFDVTISDLRDATQDEIAHGHAHGPDGHHHHHHH